MARSRIPITVIDLAGNAVSAAQATVKIRSTGANATIYQAETGATTISNPSVADSAGRVPGWVDRGAYYADITGTGITGYRVDFDAGPAGDAAIDDLWLPVDARDARLDAIEARATALEGPRVKVRNSAAIVGVSSSFIAINTGWDTEEFDTNAMHDNVNPSRLTVVKAGVYYVQAFAAWSTEAANTYRSIRIRQTILAGGSQLIAENETMSSTSPGMTQHQCGDYTVAAVGDYFTFEAAQGGGTVNMSQRTTSSPGCSFSARWVA
jgi:hypothetical protein